MENNIENKQTLSAPEIRLPLPNKAWKREIINPTTLKMLGLINLGQ